MNLRDSLRQKYQQLVAQPTSPGFSAGSGLAAPGAQLQFAWNDGELRVELCRVEPLACELWRLELRAQRLTSLDAEALSALGQKLCAQVRYLMEPLQVQEIDRAQAAVQARSAPPEREPDLVRYFELQLTPTGGIQLVRYEKRPGTPRAQIVAPLTADLLLRLCQDLHDLAK